MTGTIIHDFGFLATTRLNAAQCRERLLDPSCGHRFDIVSDTADCDPILLHANFETDNDGCLVSLWVPVDSNPDDDTPFVGQFLGSVDYLSSDLALISEWLAVLCAQIDGDYIVAGDEDILAEWSYDSPFCPHVLGIYRKPFIEENAAVEKLEQLSLSFPITLSHTKDDFTIVAYRGTAPYDDKHRLEFPRAFLDIFKEEHLSE